MVSGKNVVFGIIGWILATIGIWLLVEGFINHWFGLTDMTMVFGYYFIGLLFLGIAFWFKHMIFGCHK